MLLARIDPTSEIDSSAAICSSFGATFVYASAWTGQPHGGFHRARARGGSFPGALAPALGEIGLTRDGLVATCTGNVERRARQDMLSSACQ